MPERSLNIPFYARGLHFSCKRCSSCCRYESGFVFLSEKDASRLAAALNMGHGEFQSVFCRWISVENGRSQLSLKEKSNFDCIFWTLNKNDGTESGCSVYNERPLQCRAFPFWSSMLSSKEGWEAAAGDCPGIGQGSFHSFESINKWLDMRNNEPIISRKVTVTGDAGLGSGFKSNNGSRS